VLCHDEEWAQNPLISTDFCPGLSQHAAHCGSAYDPARQMDDGVDAVEIRLFVFARLPPSRATTFVTSQAKRTATKRMCG
jgi:hypothetical protein